MAVTHSAVLRNALAAAVLANIDSDVGAGNLVYRTSGDVVVATLPLSDPAGVVAAEVLTFSAITSDTNAVGGTVAKATIDDNSGDNALSGSVTASGGGGDIIMSSLTVGAGDTVSTSSLTYTAPV